MTVEIIILTKLIIFGIVCYGNAKWIIFFNRACQYDVTTEDKHAGSGEGSVKMIPRGTMIPETKMILWWVKKWADEKVGYFWSKPIYSCPTCMASLHGIIPFLFLEYHLVGFSLVSILHWMFYTGVLSGVATRLNES